MDERINVVENFKPSILSFFRILCIYL